MRHLLACVLGLLALGVTAASAAPEATVHVAGHGYYSVDPYGPTKIEVGAQSDVLGTHPSGHILVQTFAGDGVPDTLYHGDVRDGCVLTVGDRAVAVGRLKEDEQFDTPRGRIEFIAVLVEDNGEPSDAQPDRVFTLLLRDPSAQAFCAGLLPATTATIPIESGNFVVRAG